MLRFLEFSDLRVVIHDNPEVFKPTLSGHETGSISWFERAMDRLEPFRNRIAHCNTLTEDDENKFNEDVKVVLSAIRPHIEVPSVLQ